MFLTKCEFKNGYCRKICKSGEYRVYISKWKCRRNTRCCARLKDIKPLSSSNKIYLPATENRQLSATKKLKTIIVVTTAATVWACQPVSCHRISGSLKQRALFCVSLLSISTFPCSLHSTMLDRSPQPHCMRSSGEHTIQAMARQREDKSKTPIQD